MSEQQPRVAVIGTGGTISSVGRDGLDIVRYVDVGKIYEVDELRNTFPETLDQADVVPVRLRAMPSTAIGPAEWLEIAAKIHELANNDPDLAGVVVTHGTATLEETAYFLNLTLKVNIPVVLVGAQRPATGLSTDAGMNLVNAIRTAKDPASRGRGVLALLNDEIHFARDVTKTSTLRLQTFKSRDFGLLGHADFDKIAYYRMPERRRAPDTEFDVRGATALPRVDISLTYAGSDGTVIDALGAAGATRDRQIRNASYDGLESEGAYGYIQDWNAPEYRIRAAADTDAFTYDRRLDGDKIIDLVGAFTDVVDGRELLAQFDLESCKASFDGRVFRIPDPQRSFRGETRMDPRRLELMSAFADKLLEKPPSTADGSPPNIYESEETWDAICYVFDTTREGQPKWQEGVVSTDDYMNLKMHHNWFAKLVLRQEKYKSRGIRLLDVPPNFATVEQRIQIDSEDPEG